MKRVAIVSLSFCLIFLSACISQVNFSDQDEDFVFTFSDIKNFNMDNYEYKSMKNGKDYFYTKSNSKMNGFNCMYRAEISNQNKDIIKLTTTINLQTKEERASQLFKNSAKTSKMLYGSNVKSISVNDYKVDEILVVEAEKYFTILIRKDKLFYSLEIDGLSVKEEDVKDKLLKKIDVLIGSDINDIMDSTK